MELVSVHSGLMTHKHIYIYIVASVRIPVMHVVRHSGNGDMLTHKCMHSSECPYSYDVCNKTFSVKSNLLSHEIHT